MTVPQDLLFFVVKYCCNTAILGIVPTVLGFTFYITVTIMYKNLFKNVCDDYVQNLVKITLCDLNL